MDWINELSNLKSRISQRMSSSLYTKNESNFLFKKSNYSYESKLYKLFYYDELIEHWCFNSDIFDQFSKDKKNDIQGSKIPLVLFMNSDENELIKINSYFINGMFPNLDKIDNFGDQIFVYALGDKSLFNLNYKLIFNNTEKTQIKPIFLLLHVPKNKTKMKNIQNIITSIYAFLYSVCNLCVVILTKEHYIDQINFFKSIKNINHCHFFHSVTNDSDINNNNSDSDNNNNNSDSDNNNNSDSDNNNNNSDSDNNNNSDSDDNSYDEYDDFSYFDDFSYYNQKYNKVEEEDFDEWENINFDENQTFSTVLMKKNNICFKHPVTIFLINDETIQFDEEMENNVLPNSLFKNLFKDNDNHFHFINLNLTNTFKSFLNDMNNILYRNFFLFQTIKSNFESEST